MSRPCPLPARAGLVALVALSGCNQAEGVAQVRCETDPGASGWPGCPGLEDPLDFEADFFALQRFESLVEIRLQQGGRGPDDAQGLHLQVLDREEVARDCLRGNIPMGLPDLVAPDRFPACRADHRCESPPDCPLVRMALHFPRSCPDTAPPLVAGDPEWTTGQDANSHIVFVGIGTRPGDTVSGSFDVRLADARTGAPVGRCRTLGDGFSFVVKEGQPYVRFVE